MMKILEELAEFLLSDTVSEIFIGAQGEIQYLIIRNDHYSVKKELLIILKITCLE